MKYCRNCGAKLTDEANFCTTCGSNQNSNSSNQVNYSAHIYQPNSPSQSPNNPYAGNTLGIISLGLAVMVPIGGIVCGIIAINRAKKVLSGVKIIGNKLGLTLGIAGIVIAIIAWIMNIITMLGI